MNPVTKGYCHDYHLVLVLPKGFYYTIILSPNLMLMKIALPFKNIWSHPATNYGVNRPRPKKYLYLHNLKIQISESAFVGSEIQTE